MSFSLKESRMIWTGISGACVLGHFCVHGEAGPGRAGGCSGGCVVRQWLEKGYYKPKCVNFAVADTTHRLSFNDLGNSGLDTLARGLCSLSKLTALS